MTVLKVLEILESDHGPLTHTLRENTKQGRHSNAATGFVPSAPAITLNESVGGSERLISLFYIYPFRCQPYGHRFRLLQWGVTYTRIEKDRRVGRKRKGWIDKQKSRST
jgi:hypothetical protein